MTTRPSTGRRPIVHWDEEDVYTTWRRAYAYLRKSGAVKFTKRRTHKRERREARAALRKDPDNA